MSIDPKRDVLFLGVGDSASAWYRCYLPALHMGADWCGIYGEPPKIAYKTGLVRGQGGKLPNLADYKVIVSQQTKGRAWFKVFDQLRRQHGVKVVFEIDDYIHGVARKQDHQYADKFGPEAIAAYELNMQAADAIICSTDFLGRKYRRFNRTFVCPNGIDPARYRLTRPSRPKVNIGWAGATGHRDALIPWLQQVATVMQKHEDTAFITIGQPFANGFREFFPDRCIATPFASIETYPAAMTLFDVAIAPAGKDLFYRAKSDLRWLEAAALGIPIVADPTVYPEIEHAVTGFHASDALEAGEILDDLVQDHELRERVGQQAKEYVLEHRTMEALVSNWTDVFEALDV